MQAISRCGLGVVGVTALNCLVNVLYLTYKLQRRCVSGSVICVQEEFFSTILGTFLVIKPHLHVVLKVVNYQRFDNDIGCDRTISQRWMREDCGKGDGQSRSQTCKARFHVGRVKCQNHKHHLRHLINNCGIAIVQLQSRAPHYIYNQLTYTPWVLLAELTSHSLSPSYSRGPHPVHTSFPTQGFYLGSLRFLPRNHGINARRQTTTQAQLHKSMVLLHL